MTTSNAITIKKKELLDLNGVAKGDYWQTARKMHTVKAAIIDNKAERSNRQRSERREKRKKPQ